MSDTVFHKIVKGELPAHIFWEDEDHIAFLDIFPSYYAQSLVIPKNHTTSKFSQADTEILTKLTVASQKVAKLLEKKLDEVKRVLIVIEGLDVDYLHFKLYPATAQTEKTPIVGAVPTKASETELIDIHSLLTS